MEQSKTKMMWVVKVFHSFNRVDFYYRDKKDNAEGLYEMNKRAFPKATVTLKYKQVTIAND